MELAGRRTAAPVLVPVRVPERVNSFIPRHKNYKVEPTGHFADSQADAYGLRDQGRGAADAQGGGVGAPNVELTLLSSHINALRAAFLGYLLISRTRGFRMPVSLELASIRLTLSAIFEFQNTLLFFRRLFVLGRNRVFGRMGGYLGVALVLRATPDTDDSTRLPFDCCLLVRFSLLRVVGKVERIVVIVRHRFALAPATTHTLLLLA